MTSLLLNLFCLLMVWTITCFVLNDKNNRVIFETMFFFMVNKEDNINFFIKKILNHIYIIDIMIYLIKMSSILMLY